MLFPAFDETRIRAGLSPASAAALQQLTLLDQTGSTNDLLLQLPDTERHAHAVLADQQTAGRGRRGRRWQSPAGSNIYLSLGWEFSQSPGELSCLPLAMGVAAVLGLERCGLAGLGLKWPNDIQVNGRKLGGVLMESRATRSGRTSVVAGIGLNVAMSAENIEAEAIDQPWTSVAECLAGAAVGSAASSVLSSVNGDLRDRVAGQVLDQLMVCFRQFAGNGFENYRPDWLRLDVLQGRAVSVRSDERTWHGQSHGVDHQGRLLLAVKTPDGQRQLRSLDAGDVSVRLV